MNRCIGCDRELDPATHKHVIVEAAGIVLYYHADLDGKFCWPNREVGKLHQDNYRRRYVRQVV